MQHDPYDIAAIVERSGVKQRAIAKHMGVSESCVSQMLADGRNSRVSTIRRILAAIEASVPISLPSDPVSATGFGHPAIADGPSSQATEPVPVSALRVSVPDVVHWDAPNRIYIKFADVAKHGLHIRKWSVNRQFDGAALYLCAGSGAPLGPFDSDEEYSVEQLPDALRLVAEQLWCECEEHVVRDHARIVLTAADALAALRQPQGKDAVVEDKCWVVWAMKPGDLQLVAICKSRGVASRYRKDAGQLFPEHRLSMEQAPMDHLFGASDLRSVAFRAALSTQGAK